MCVNHSLREFIQHVSDLRRHKYVLSVHVGFYGKITHFALTMCVNHSLREDVLSRRGVRVDYTKYNSKYNCEKMWIRTSACGSKRGENMAARVVVACGAGVATSHAVANKLRKLLGERGVEADIRAVSMSDLREALAGADAYVAVVKPKETFDVPTFNGVAFVTGMGEDEELDRLIATLKGKALEDE